MLSKDFVRTRLAPFKSPPYRRYFSVQLISLTGTWMQELARSWIVLELLGKASAIGLLLVASALPNLIFGSFGGVLADRKGARTILIVTQVMLAFFALCMGFLVQTGHVEFHHLIIFSVLEGIVLAFDVPAINTVTPQLVPKEDFRQALALNSVSFHFARVVGPAVAGLLMGLAGPASVFWVNAVSFMGVVAVLLRLPLSNQGAAPEEKSSRAALRETWDYIRSQPIISAILVQFFWVMVLVFPLIFTTLRIHIRDSFGLNAKEFGLVFAMPGIGALLGSLVFLLTTPKNPLKVLPAGLFGIVSCLLGIATAHTLPITLIFLVAYSFSMFLTLSALLVTIQIRIENRVRGRISAITGMAFVSLAPIASAPMGYLTDMLGPRKLITIAAIAFGVLSVWVGLARKSQEPLEATA